MAAGVLDSTTDNRLDSSLLLWRITLESQDHLILLTVH